MSKVSEFSPGKKGYTWDVSEIKYLLRSLHKCVISARGHFHG